MTRVETGAPRPVNKVSVVVVSYNVRSHLERSLIALSDEPHEVIVVDSASTDGSAQLVRERFPGVRLIELARNEGYGSAANVGLSASRGDYFLVMNADARPLAAGIAQLVAYADSHPRIGIAGPRLLNTDGSLQPSVRGFPTLWRLATEYFFLRWLAPRSRLLNAFYGANFDYRISGDAEFLVGAALLLRRHAIEEVGAFDPAFNEEVDLCYRMRQEGWRVAFFPGAEFVHDGGASTSGVWSEMYREQMRSHLLFFAKHYGIERAEQARRLLVWAFTLRALVFRGDRGRLTRDTRKWLASGDAADLIHHSPRETDAAGPARPCDAAGSRPGEPVE
jgi:N-acetylglucosaminyl-diphospho-decaprenol L-rhamnosyltransferase